MPIKTLIRSYPPSSIQHDQVHMNFINQIWDVKKNGVLNFDNIRKLYPDEGYRLKEGQYEPGEKHYGRMRSGKWYIISGMGRVNFESEQRLVAGQIVDLPAGEYQLEALGQEPLHYVVAWKLPPPFHKSKTTPNQGHYGGDKRLMELSTKTYIG